MVTLQFSHFLFKKCFFSDDRKSFTFKIYSVFTGIFCLHTISTLAFAHTHTRCLSVVNNFYWFLNVYKFKFNHQTIFRICVLRALCLFSFLFKKITFQLTNDTDKPFSNVTSLLFYFDFER